jgi:hypothetical protein
MPTISADHTYYVDLGPDSDFTTGSFVSVFPEDCEFDHTIRGIGNISFQLSYTATDQDGALAVPSKDFIGPYRSYWRLRYGDTAIIAGVITKTNTKLVTDFMSVFGKTWEHLLEKWEYPFDPRTAERVAGDPASAPIYDYVFTNSFQNDETVASGTTVPQGLVYQAGNRDVILIAGDILGVVMSRPDRVIFDLSSLSGISGIKTNYTLTLGDTSKMDSLVDGLAETGDGFDWWISHDKVFKWGSPYRYGNPSAPFLFYMFTLDDADNGFLMDLEFTNNGPVATHVLGTGAGLASQTTIGRAYGYAPAQTQFSRLDESFDYGDVRNAAQLSKKTQKQLALSLNPVHEIPISLDPAFYSTYWADFRVGRAIYITADMGYHLIDSAQQLVSFQGKLDNNGNADVDWTLQQVYDTSSNVGTAEG